MIATIQYNSRNHKIDLSNPLDISIPLIASKSNVNAWYVEEPKIEAVKVDDETVSVKEGACVNFNNMELL